MDLQQIFSVVVSFVGSLLLVCLAVLLGWYFVWKFFLSRFRLVRELLGQINDTSDPASGANSKDARKTTKPKKIRRD